MTTQYEENNFKSRHRVIDPLVLTQLGAPLRDYGNSYNAYVENLV